MGNPKQKWTAEEEEALRAGIAKHGTGKWMTIHKDPEFNRILSTRTNIDLKDKWRNLSVGNNLGPRDKPHTPKPKPKPKPSPEASSAVPLSSPQTSTPSITVTHDAPADSVTTDSSSRSLADGKLAPWYNAMIFEAFSASKDPKELDTSTILGFIEQKHEGPVPTNVRRYLTSRLRKLAQQDKLEKVQNGLYRLKTEEPLSNTRTPLPKQKDISPAQAPSTPTINQCSGDAEREAAIAAAYKIAEAENKACVAVEAVKEAERVSKMAEDADALLQLAIEIFDRCNCESRVCFICLLALHFPSVIDIKTVLPLIGLHGETVLLA